MIGSMPNGDPTVFGLPCRFPAAASILAERRAQVYDCMRFSGAEGSREKFFPGFFPRGRERERRRYPATRRERSLLPWLLKKSYHGAPLAQNQGECRNRRLTIVKHIRHSRGGEVDAMSVSEHFIRTLDRRRFLWGAGILGGMSATFPAWADTYIDLDEPRTHSLARQSSDPP